MEQLEIKLLPEWNAGVAGGWRTGVGVDKQALPEWEFVSHTHEELCCE